MMSENSSSTDNSNLKNSDNNNRADKTNIATNANNDTNSNKVNQMNLANTESTPKLKNRIKFSHGISQKEILRRSIWPAALSGLFFLVYYVVGTIMCIAREKAFMSMYSYSQEQYQSELLATVSKLLGVRGEAYLFVIVLAVMLAIYGFSWLDSKRKIDFYESQPVSRTKRFCAVYLNSFLVYVIPCAVFLGAGILIALGMGAMNGVIVLEALYEFCRMTVLFLAVYSVAVLATVLTGNVIIAVMASIVLLLFEILFCRTLTTYMSTFFATFTYGKGDITPVLSPLYNYFQIENSDSVLLTLLGGTNEYYGGYYDAMTMSQLTKYFDQGLPYDIWSLMLFAVTSLIAFVCYKKRPNESAGKAVPFAWVRVIVELGITVLGSLMVGEVVSTGIFSGSRSEMSLVLTVTAIVLSAAVISCVIRIIYEFNFRAALHGSYMIVISAIVAVGIFGVFRYDLVSYDSYIPDSSTVGSAVLMPTDYMIAYYKADGTSYDSNDEYHEQNMYLTDIEAVENIAEIAQKYTTETVKSGDSNTYAEGYAMNVIYRLKNGRKVYRSFTVPYDIDPEYMDAVIGSDQYKESFFGLDKEGEYVANAGDVTATYDNGHGNLATDEFNYDDFKAAYETDIKQYNYSMAHNNMPVGNIAFSSSSMNYVGSVSYPIYASYSNTIKWLKSEKIWINTEVNIDDVEQISVTNYHNEVYADGQSFAGDPSVSVVYTDPDDMKMVIDASIPSSITGTWQTNDTQDYNYSIVVTYKEDAIKNASAYGYDGLYYYNFFSDKVPEKVANDTAAG